MEFSRLDRFAYHPFCKKLPVVGSLGRYGMTSQPYQPRLERTHEEYLSQLHTMPRPVSVQATRTRVSRALGCQPSTVPHLQSSPCAECYWDASEPRTAGLYEERMSDGNGLLRFAISITAQTSGSLVSYSNDLRRLIPSWTGGCATS